MKAANKFILMTGSKFVLDTNIIVALLKGEESIADKIDKATDIYIPIIVVGELYYGALYSTHVEKNKTKIKKLISAYNLLNIDEDVTLEYGQIKTQLRKAGKPIPENDIWIAAIAKRNKLTLITRDKHFKAVDEIAVKHW